MQFLSERFVMKGIVQRTKPEVRDTEGIVFRMTIGRISVGPDFHIMIEGVMGISVLFR